MEFIVRILETKQVTHNVKRFRLEKPAGYSFHPGQATDVSVNKPDWREEKRPFTFTCLAEDPFLEFTIKRYPDHHGVTDELHRLQPGDELILRDVWGAIEYKGPGCFIAGGAGITPFLAILRQLHKQKAVAGNTLFFSNRTDADVIEEQELRSILGPKALFVLTNQAKDDRAKDDPTEKDQATAGQTKRDQATAGQTKGDPATADRTRNDRAGTDYIDGRIDSAFLRQHVGDFHQPFYICGPDPMIAEISGLLTGMGAAPTALVFEK